jgi:PBP1b-binding outer membrane lipoprotein LpoB
MKMAKKNVAAASLALVALLLSGCASATSSAQITTAPDKPTFLYFYTDG